MVKKSVMLSQMDKAKVVSQHTVTVPFGHTMPSYWGSSSGLF